MFQLEGGPMRALMRTLRPTNFEDVAALLALYRPGPMAANMHTDYADRKNGRKPIVYDHDDLAEVLGDTYGLMVYQESMMRVAQKIAGYSLADADLLRRACGKKSRQLIAVEREKFVDGVDRMGYGRALGTRLFDIIEPFADYAFGKSHAFGYALIAYQTAYLKAHYPVEYLACLLTSVKSSLEKAAVYIAECRSLGIKVLPPDVNVSMANFTAMSPDEVADGVTLPPGSPGAISFGLSAVRNVGEGLVAQLLAEREANGPYASFHEFADRVPEPVLNKRAVESLIKAGAFDSLGHPRRGLLGVFEQVTNATLSRRRERELGVMSLFGDVEQSGADGYDERLPVPDVEFDKSELLRAEKEMLGLYVSDHPLFGKEAALRRKVEQSIGDLDDLDDGTTVHIGGVVTGTEPAVHQARRPDGHVHARRPRRRGRGHAVPAHPHRARSQARRRPDRRRPRPPRQARRESHDGDLPVPRGARRARGRCTRR